MKRIDFSLENGPHIELIRLLKATGVARTGGQAKELVSEELIIVDGYVEHRFRAKIRAGSVVMVDSAISIHVEE